MTQWMSVQTPFEDVGELIEVLASHGEGTSLVLPHTDFVADGEWVQFSIALNNGEPAFQGLGQCRGAFEASGGEQYEVVLDALQVDGDSAHVYEQILVTRGTHENGVDGVADADVEGNPFGVEVGSSLHPVIDDKGDTGEVHLGELIDGGGRSAARSRTKARKKEGAFELRRPSFESEFRDSWTAPRSARPSSGLFAYSGSVPLPAAPPRPDVPHSRGIAKVPKRHLEESYERPSTPGAEPAPLAESSPFAEDSLENDSFDSDPPMLEYDAPDSEKLSH